MGAAEGCSGRTATKPRRIHTASPVEPRAKFACRSDSRGRGPDRAPHERNRAEGPKADHISPPPAPTTERGAAPSSQNETAQARATAEEAAPTGPSRKPRGAEEPHLKDNQPTRPPAPTTQVGAASSSRSETCASLSAGRGGGPDRAAARAKTRCGLLSEPSPASPPPAPTTEREAAPSSQNETAQARATAEAAARPGTPRKPRGAKEPHPKTTATSHDSRGRGRLLEPKRDLRKPERRPRGRPRPDRRESQDAPRAALRTKPRQPATSPDNRARGRPLEPKRDGTSPSDGRGGGPDRTAARAKARRRPPPKERPPVERSRRATPARCPPCRCCRSATRRRGGPRR